MKNKIIFLFFLVGLFGCSQDRPRNFIFSKHNQKIDTMEFIYKNDKIGTIKSTTKPVSVANNIQGTVIHRNYLDYLSKCYASHNGIVIKPDYIWYTILCEMAIIIKDNPEAYRKVFTDSQEKKDVQVLTLDPVVMPIDTLTKEVFKLIPSGLKQDDVILNFSTTTQSSTFAFSTSFLDAASPYYNYMMYMCGYNKIKVLGSIEDYEMMSDAISRLKNIYDGTDTVMINYLNKSDENVQNIIYNWENKDFWNKIFYLEECGSGSQVEAKGWFTDFFNKYPSVGYVENFSTHISIVEYKNIDTDKDYVMNSGLLSSIIEGDYLIPDFEFYVLEKEVYQKQQDSIKNSRW